MGPDLETAECRQSPPRSEVRVSHTEKVNKVSECVPKWLISNEQCYVITLEHGSMTGPTDSLLKAMMGWVDDDDGDILDTGR